MFPQVTAICKSAFYHLRKIRLIRKHLTFDTAQLLVQALVTSKLDYCNSLLYGLPKNVIKQLQRVQNAAIGVRAGGARGVAAPPNFGQLRFFGQHEKIWAKPEEINIFYFNLKSA